MNLRQSMVLDLERMEVMLEISEGINDPQAHLLHKYLTETILMMLIITDFMASLEETQAEWFAALN